MKRYPKGYNPIVEYWNDIQSGKEIVGDKIRRTYRKLIYDTENPGEWFFSPERANHVIEFAENFCRHSKGKFGGKLVELELWEKAMLAAIFGFINKDGIRKYQRAVLIIGKKNGKSLLASIVALYMLFADGEKGPEVYAVATKRDQAKIIWSESKKMIKKSPELRQRARTLVASIECDINEGSFKPLASDSDSMDGLNVHCVLMDEFHQWKNGKPLYDIMADGITARESPLIFMTSTAGTIREDIYDSIYEEAKNTVFGYFEKDVTVDERSVFFIYEIDKKEEWTDPKCWRKANPGLGTIKNERTLREKVERAKNNPKEIKNLVCKEFNIPETSEKAWLAYDEIKNEACFDVEKLKPKYFIGGADLSGCNDLTAAKAIFELPGSDFIYVMQMYWIPEDLVEKKVQEDKICYDIWIEKGLCRTTPGNKINYTYVTEWFLELRDKLGIYPLFVGYDNWSAEYWVQEMAGYFGKNCMIPIKQTTKELSAPLQAMTADLVSKKIIYNNNPIDRWCLTNTAVFEDRYGNIKPIKTNKSKQRIDGTMALLDAYTVLFNKGEEYRSMI